MPSERIKSGCSINGQRVAAVKSAEASGSFSNGPASWKCIPFISFGEKNLLRHIELSKPILCFQISWLSYVLLLKLALSSYFRGKLKVQHKY